jgi:GT2 family glycosyltransferase
VTRLASGWRLDADEHGPLLRAPRGALRLDGEVVTAIEREARVSRVLRAVLREVLGRLGGLTDHAVAEPPRPAAPERGPLVSVVIPTCDQRELLVACLESLRAQTYADLEVLVVDGGSSDDTRQAVARTLPAASIVALPGNPGFAHACNRGAREAAGEHLLVLNDDTRLAPDAIAQLVGVTQRRPRRLGAVCAMTRRADLPPVIESLGNVAGAGGFGSGRLAGFIDLGQFARDGELFSAAFTCVLIPRAALEAVGPLDERYGFYYEDMDWSLRARMGGLHVQPAPHALCFHEGSASTSARPSAFKLRMVTRNRLLWAGKVLRARNAGGFGRRYVLEDVRSAVRAVREGRLDEAAVVPRAWLAATAQLPSLLRAREELAAWHVVPDENLFRTASVPIPLMDGPYVRLDAGVLRGHYLHVPAVADAVARSLRSHA